MKFIIFLVAVAALVVAILAYKRTGGTGKDLGKELEKPLGQLRDKTADTLNKLSNNLRKDGDKDGG